MLKKETLSGFDIVHGSSLVNLASILSVNLYALFNADIFFYLFFSGVLPPVD